LPAFVCTDPPKKPAYGLSPHRRPWELEVQSYVRALRPPVKRPGEVLLIGERDGQIGAVVHFAEADDPCNVFLKVIGVAWELRQLPEAKGGAFGRELMATTVDLIRQRAREAECGDEISVVGHIDENNAASQRLCAEFGFVALPVPPPGPGLRVWQAAFPL